VASPARDHVQILADDLGVRVGHVLAGEPDETHSGRAPARKQVPRGSDRASIPTYYPQDLPGAITTASAVAGLMRALTALAAVSTVPGRDGRLWSSLRRRL